MKLIYTLLIAMLAAQLCYAQTTPTPQPQAQPNPNAPAPPQQIPVLLDNGGLPGIGTTLNQDYNCVGINPANLGFVTTGAPVITFGFIGLSGGITTDAVNLSNVEHFFTDSLPFQQALTQGFTNHGISISLNIMDFGASVQIPKIGGFAFTIEDHILLNVYMNPLFASIGFNGLNSPYFNSVLKDSNNVYTGVTSNPQSVAQAFKNSYVKGSYTREYAISYGREILNFGDNSHLYVGGSLKYVAGFGFADGSIDDNGNVNAVLAYSSTFSSIGDSTKKFNAGSVALAGPTAVAHGEGFDLGGTVIINDRIRAGASITDVGLGDMTWSGTTYQVVNSPVDSFKKYVDPSSLFKNGIKSTIVLNHPTSFAEPLPTQLHLGGSIFFIKKFVVAADMDIPLNSVGGNLEDPIITLSGGYVVGNALRITLGLQSMAYTNIAIPLGIIIGTGQKAVWQWGVSYADVGNLFRSNSVVLGGSFFFLRFRV